MKAFIKHISYYLPDKKLSNEELAVLFPERDAENIFQKTGIRVRAISGENEISSDMAFKAAELFFKEHPDVSKSKIDFLIFCTQGPDYFMPTTACLLQSRIGLNTNIGAYDLNLGCSGFVYGLSQAKGLIETGQAKNVLLLTSEAITKVLHPKDRSSRTLGGDAAAAILISTRMENGIDKFIFGTNGNNADTMIMKAGGKRFPLNKFQINEFTDEHGNISSDEYFYMNGPAVLTFAAEVVPKMVNDLTNISFKKDEIDYYIFHQANQYILEMLRRLLKIPSEKFCINLSETGNTVASTIPIALKDSIDKGKVKKGDKLMLVTFGVGSSWAATTIII